MGRSNKVELMYVSLYLRFLCMKKRFNFLNKRCSIGFDEMFLMLDKEDVFLAKWRIYE